MAFSVPGCASGHEVKRFHAQIWELNEMGTKSSVSVPEYGESDETGMKSNAFVPKYEKRPKCPIALSTTIVARGRKTYI